MERQWCDGCTGGGSLQLKCCSLCDSACFFPVRIELNEADSFLMDTWQYFMHRLFHTSRFLYRHIHSVHHRLYVPYAFGALYNHPLEGFVFDTLGALIVQEASRMSIRQTVFFFAFSTMKTVDDHSGYKLWWDPCQFIFPNNADYHDIHHQVYGMKSNFSQPYL